MGRLIGAICSVIVLFCFSFAAVEYRSVAVAMTAVAAHFVLLKIIPVFRKRESVWMFIFVAFSTVPVNIHTLSILNRFIPFFSHNFFLGLIECAIYYAMLFSIEEIVMGIITRFFWRNQKKTVL